MVKSQLPLATYSIFALVSLSLGSSTSMEISTLPEPSVFWEAELMVPVGAVLLAGVSDPGVAKIGSEEAYLRINIHRK